MELSFNPTLSGTFVNKTPHESHFRNEGPQHIVLTVNIYIQLMKSLHRK